MTDAAGPRGHFEATYRQVLDRRDPDEVAAFVAAHPGAATAELTGFPDHPLGVTPLGYVAMARYDTATGRWRDVAGAGAVARVLLAAGAPANGEPGDRETPLITAASYGDAEVVAALIAAGADLDAVAADDAGGVPGGSAVLHAAVFGMTAVLDVLVAAGARVRSLEEAAAAGRLDGWDLPGADEQIRVRAMIMAAHHQRLAAIEALVATGTPFDEPDASFGRHPLRLAAAEGRLASVRALLALGAEPSRRDGAGLTALDHCRLGRRGVTDTTAHDAIERLLAG